MGWRGFFYCTQVLGCKGPVTGLFNGCDLDVGSLLVVAPLGCGFDLDVRICLADHGEGINGVENELEFRRLGFGLDIVIVVRKL